MVGQAERVVEFEEKEVLDMVGQQVECVVEFEEREVLEMVGQQVERVVELERYFLVIELVSEVVELVIGFVCE